MAQAQGAKNRSQRRRKPQQIPSLSAPATVLALVLNIKKFIWCFHRITGPSRSVADLRFHWKHCTGRIIDKRDGIRTGSVFYFTVSKKVKPHNTYDTHNKERVLCVIESLLRSFLRRIKWYGLYRWKAWIIFQSNRLGSICFISIAQQHFQRL